MLVGFNVISRHKKSITIDYPIQAIDDNISQVGGIFMNIKETQMRENIKIIVHPVGSNDYWVIKNEQESDIAVKNNTWSAECRFGDELIEANKQDFPIEFWVYAIYQNKLKLDTSRLVASSEGEFIKIISKYTSVYSNKLIVTRNAPLQAITLFKLVNNKDNCVSKSRKFVPAICQSSDDTVNYVLEFDGLGEKYLEIWKNSFKDTLSNYYYSGSKLTFCKEDSTKIYNIKLKDKENCKYYSELWFIHRGKYPK
jgi:hypothetical protein